MYSYVEGHKEQIGKYNKVSNKMIQLCNYSPLTPTNFIMLPSQIMYILTKKSL